MASIVVLGGGIAGLTAALVLGRAGHAVTVCEQDPTVSPTTSANAFSHWRRKGVGQFYHPHSFLGRACELLRNRLADVFEDLLAHGAEAIDLAAKLPGFERERADDRMKFLACRRATFEWVLRRAVERESRALLLGGIEVDGLNVTRSSASDLPRVTGVRTRQHGIIEADLVVDAGGRRSGVVGWLSAANVNIVEDVQDCELTYYSRHYELRPGVSPPEGPWLIGPSAELGLVRFALDRGDRRTFALTVCAWPLEERLRALKHEPVWATVAHSFPAFRPWLERATPTTRVLPMASMRNVLRRFANDGRPLVVGLLSIGDALCQTNPQHAWGASLAVQHAFAVADALRDHPTDALEQGLAYFAAISDDTERRFQSSAGEDRARGHWNRGAKCNPLRPSSDKRLFVRHVVYPTAFADPVLFRAVVRRVNMIDPPDVLEDDRGLHERAIAAYSRVYPAGPPWQLDAADLYDLIEQGRTRGELDLREAM